VFLNNDTIVSIGWLQNLLSTFTDPSIGIAGPLLLYPQEGMIIQHAGVDIGKVEETIFPFHIYRGRSIEETPQALVKKEYMAVTGACLMIRKELLDLYGAFDERFVNSYEDVDLCLRMRSKGYKIIYNPASIVVHLESQTPGRNTYDKQNQQLLNSIWSHTIPVTAESYLRMVESLTRDVLLEDPHSLKSMENLIFVYKELQESLLLAKYNQLYNEEEKLQKKSVEVSIIIPIYNGLQYTRQCLKHLIESTPQTISYEIIIVDNASQDGTREVMEELQKSIPFLRYIRNNENLGFAKACNIGIDQSNSNYILLLNNDTMTTPRWLETLYETMQSNNRIGIAGSILLFPETEWIQHAGIEIGVYEDEQNVIPIFPIHTFQYCHRSALQTTVPYEVPAVTGASMMIRTSVLRTVGNLDEEFVNGCEDVDLCFRVKNAGFEVKVVPSSIVFHYEGRTEGRANKTNENLKLLAKKYDSNSVVTISAEVTYNHYHFARLKELLRVDTSNSEITTTAIHLATKMNVNSEVALLSKSLSLQNANEPILSIIIPVKNNVHYTKHCIQSIREFTPNKCYEIIVVDNNSSDETKEFIESIQTSIPIKHLYNAEPKTYSESNNQGASIAKGKFLVFLNNDTKLFPTWAEHLITTFDEYSDIAIQGARLVYPNHTIQHAGIEFNQEILKQKNAFVHQHSYLTFEAWNKNVTFSRTVPMVTGAFLSIRSDVFNQIAGFDEKYRFGHEDLDLCLSVLKADLKTFYNASIVAYHYESKTKLEEGIEKFQRFMNDPSNIDFQNQQYFDSKWKSFLHSHFGSENLNTTTSKRILMTMFGWNESGGGTSYPKALAKSLVHLGHSVTVMYAGGKSSTSTEPFFVEKSSEDGVTLYGIFNRPTTFLDEKNLKREVQYPEIDAIFKTILESVQPEIVHFHNFLGLGYSIATMAKEFGARTYFTTHNYHCIDPKLYMFNVNLERWKSISFEDNSDLVKNDTSVLVDYKYRKEEILRTITSSIDTILPVSNRQKKLFVEFGISAEKMNVVNQIAEVHRKGQFPQDNRTVHNPLQIGYIGGVMPHKGVHLLIASVQPFSNSQLQVRIFGFVEPKYKEFLQSIDTKGIVQWEGSYTIEELSNKLSTVDMMVLPSLWEDCAPLTITEALGYGKPVIAPSLGGFTDFVFHGVNGYIYNPDNATAIVEILNKVLSDKTILRTLKTNSFLPYGFNYVVEWYNQLYSTSTFKELSFEDAMFAKLPQNSTTSIEEHEVGFSKAKAQGEMPHPLPSPLYLNLGCGNDIREECINIDMFSDNPKVVYMDIRKLLLPDGCVDGIIASDVLEHFSHRETESILKEWSRVLKKGGEIVLRSPSLRKQAEMYLSGVWDADIASFMIFGGQSNPGDFHCIGFDETTIRRYFQRVGLQVFKYEEPDIPQDKGYRNINFTVWATKK